jgi:hypothetical protein
VMTYLTLEELVEKACRRELELKWIQPILAGTAVALLV